MRFLMKTIGFLLVAGLLLAAAVLAWGHLQIHRVNPPLPDPEEILNPDRSVELPVRLTWINTASQRMPRSGVLEPEVDPHPDAPYTMSHPTFVVEWQDGRIFLIDLGMEASAAVSFGLASELTVGADPIEPHRSTSARLGKNRTRVAGIGFTHMHTDHTNGLLRLCQDLGPRGRGPNRIPVFQHHYQLSQGNHTTRPARLQLDEVDCIERRSLGSESGLIAVPDFPGVFAVPVGGHTPGSTMYIVLLRVFPGNSTGRQDDVQTWVITGDVVNHYQGIELDLPKPKLYSLLVVPESEDRLHRVRSFLKELSTKPGVRLLISHDQNHLEATALPTY